jgi:hypothetical protein
MQLFFKCFLIHTLVSTKTNADDVAARALNNLRKKMVLGVEQNRAVKGLG